MLPSCSEVFMPKWEELWQEASERKDGRGQNEIQISGRDVSGMRRGQIGRAPGGLKEN